ncbi:Peptidoglycan/LPS O-acetylase OafA/YrhL, contains acyltransferase and SGNH-hydrolase domains [Promicromonospora thailandica]|uniref:Peptidoglycan/LPS O-acetylase OafA/YrhL, contains acyltransferase and SGNH-hydrolase domains n=1 Tax=Promicromonospora thailandica TaxID=765201 RepID=A0A9X2JU15_9MICO|nr:Peptidoglycan/LPS O-acetylase OafA/YrhL, contains acyltransferase and SGNH-hydrolase domains [Promicromonospora thailandica]
MLVVLFHLFGGGRVSGGVDVFLVVSGFLVTRSLVRRADDGSLRLGAVWARNAARLAPSALLVLAAVAGGAWLLLPESRWESVWRQVVASALYVENWDLVANELSYGAAGPAASPLQHFWSLSVQGQFLLVWPVLALLVGVLARRARVRVRTVLLPLVALATVASFAYAVHLTAVQQPVAYFHTATRFWELGAGALLGLVPLGVPGRLRALGSWLGLGLVVASGFVLDGGALFPGPWTLWPVAGALLVIAGAGTPSAWGPRGTLALAPLRFLADISYELYLWHWPVLIFLMALTDVSAVGWREAALVLTVSVLLAWLTQRLVARPAARAVPRTLRPRRAVGALAAATAATALVVGPVLALQAELRQQTAQAAAEFGVVDTLHPGASALGTAEIVPAADLRPALDAAQADKGPFFTDDRCVQEHGTGPGLGEALWCDLHAPEHPTATVLLAGGSHTYQWADTFLQIARDNDWRLVLAGKGQCRVKHVPDAEHGCLVWGDNVIELATQLRPDAMVVDGTHTHYDGELEDIPAEQVAAWQLLDQAGVRLIGLRDNPRGGSEPLVRDCLAEHGVTTSLCDVTMSQVFPPVSPVLTTPGVPDSMVHVDLTEWYCRAEEDRCPAVIGNVLVYRDSSHLTNTFLRSMQPMLAEALAAQAPWLFPVEPASRP